MERKSEMESKIENENTQKIGTIIASIVEKIDINKLDYDDDLQQMGMDSIAFIRVIVTLEDEFQIEFPDDYLLIENMNTLNKIIDNVMMLRCEDSVNC